MDMKRRIFEKLSSKAGESIGETLVALLISALALMMLAGAVTSGMRVVTRSKDAMDGYYTVSNALAAKDTAKPVKDGLTVQGDFYYPNGITITASDLMPDAATYTANGWANQQLSGKPVIAYTKPKS